MNKNFSILKWIIFPLLVSAFGSGIIYVSICVFGFYGSVPSILLVVICLAISLIFILHTSNHNVKSAMIAAFTFECLGVGALGITLICSIVVLREFSGATQTIESANKQELAKGAQVTEQIKALGSLKSKTAQAAIAKQVTATPTPNATGQYVEPDKLTLASVYHKAEQYLLWPLIGEAGVYLIGLMIVFGLVQFASHASETIPVDTPQPVRQTVRNTFLAANAPLRASTAHTVDNGNGFYLSLSAQGAGVSIRFRERGNTARHVIRVSDVEAEANHLISKTYDELARWSLEKLKAEGKDSKDIYKKLEETL